MRITFVGNFNVDYTSESHHAKSLESLGHEVVRLQEAKATGDEILQEGMVSDMLILIHTHGWATPGLPLSEVLKKLKHIHVPTVTYHLDLWLGLKRQHDLDSDPFYRHIEHFFTVDKQMAYWFNENTSVKGHYLPGGVYHKECYIAPKEGEQNDVIFVGSKGYHPEWPYRPKLITWLKGNYGNRFKHYGGDGLGVVRGDRLNKIYANTKVAVGDSLSIGFNYPGYWSDRIYETMGRGGFIIHPFIEGMEEHFEDKKHLVFYEFNNFGQLKALIDYYLEHDEEREAIRVAGHEHVKNNHTYKDRWSQIISEVFPNYHTICGYCYRDQDDHHEWCPYKEGSDQHLSGLVAPNSTPAKIDLNKWVKNKEGRYEHKNG